MKVWVSVDDDDSPEHAFASRELLQQVYGEDVNGYEMEVITDLGEAKKWVTLTHGWDPGNPGGVGRPAYRNAEYRIVTMGHTYWTGLGIPEPHLYVNDPERVFYVGFSNHPHPIVCVTMHAEDTAENRAKFEEVVEQYRADHPDLEEGDPRELPRLWKRDEHGWVFHGLGLDEEAQYRTVPSANWKEIDGTWTHVPSSTQE